MKKIPQSVIYIVLVSLLGGYIYFFERGPVKTDKDKIKKIQIVPGFVADDIQKIKIENLSTTITAQKSPIEIQKDNKEVWQITEPKQYKADESTVRTMLSTVADFVPDSTIEGPANLADYGFNAPTARCTFQNKTGNSFVLLIGDKGVTGSSTYLKLSDKNTVYLLPSYTVDNLKKTVNDYRDKNLVKTDMVLAKKIQIVRNGKIFALEKDKNNVWDIIQPIIGKADESKVRDLLTTVNNLHVDSFVEDHPSNLAIYGLAAPHAKIEVWPSDGSLSKSILIGRKKMKTSNFFAKLDDSPAVYLVNQYIDSTLDVKVADFRDKSMMKFDGVSAKTLSVLHDGKTFVYQKDDKGQWSSAGRVKAQDEATYLVNLLSDIVISDFASKDATTGLKKPSFVVEVLLADGSKRTYRFGNKEKDKVYLASDKTKDVYLVLSNVVSQMDIYFNSLLTPVPVLTIGSK